MDSLINLEATRLRQQGMAAEYRIQQGRVRQKGIGDNAQLTADAQMRLSAANQILRRLEVGMHTVMEWRVG